MNSKLEKVFRTILFSGCAAIAVSAVSAQEQKNAKPDQKNAKLQMQIPVVGVDSVVTVQETGTRKYAARLYSVRDVALPARVSGKIEYTIKKCDKCGYIFKPDLKPCPKCGTLYADADTLEGEFVRKGDLLIKLEDTTYVAAKMSAEAQIKQAEAQIKQAEVNVKHTKRELDRQTQLRQGNATTEQSFDAAQRDYFLAEAALAAGKASKALAEASLLTADTNLSYTRILADFDGKIGKIAYAPGNYVTPSSSSLCQIVQFDPIYVVFSISEQDYLTNFGNPETLKKDGVVRICLADFKKSIYEKTAPVWIVDNKVDNSTGTLKIWARMENKNLRLTPGGLVEVLLSKRVPKTMPAIPISAVQTGRAGRYVWVLADEKTGMVRPQPIRTGDTVGSLIVVEDGLSAGQTVVVEGAHKIIQIPGMPVVVKPIRKSVAVK